MYNTIVKVNTALRNLGATVPTGVWSSIKEDGILSHLVMQDNETGEEYIYATSLPLLRSVYQRLYEESAWEAKIKDIKLTYKYVIYGLGFNNSNELKEYLSQMLRKYKAEQPLTQQDKSFLTDLLSRSPIIKKEVEKYSKIVDLIVAVKPGYSSKSFHIVYANGKKQHISIKNYIDPGTEKLVNI